MRNKTTTYLLLLCVFTLLFGESCVDLISIDIEESNPQKTVIQASIKKGSPSEIEVFISQSAEFVKIASGKKVSGANVQILDENQKSLLIPEKEPGYYQLRWNNDGDFDIDRGKSYQLLVELADGNVFRSEFDRIHAVPEANDVHIQLEAREVLNSEENIITTTFIQFLIETPLKHPEEEDKAYLKWDMEGVYKLVELPKPIPIPCPKTCYISEFVALDQVNVFNGFETSANKVSDYMLYEEPINAQFSAGYYLTVFQQSLSESSYKYWEQVHDVSSREGSLFESPPGKIRSNIHHSNDETNQVLGYFYVTEVDTIRIYISPDDAGRPSEPCSSFTYEDSPKYCQNCLEWPKSSLVKPAYWIE